MHQLSLQWGIDQNRPYSAEDKLILFDKLHKIVLGRYKVHPLHLKTINDQKIRRFTNFNDICMQYLLTLEEIHQV